MQKVRMRVVAGMAGVLALSLLPLAANAAPGAEDAGTPRAPVAESEAPPAESTDNAPAGAEEASAHSADDPQPPAPAPAEKTSAPVASDKAPAPLPAAERAAITPIPDIQRPGEGDDSALVGTTVTTEGVVTAVYPRGEDGLSSTLDGFTIQTPGTGGAWDPARTTSDALFAYVNKNMWKTIDAPAIGQCVQVKGVVAEFPKTSADAPAATQSLTQLSVKSVTPIEGCDPVKPTPIPAVPTAEQMEALESMLVAPQGAWTITDNYQAGQYGSLALTPGTEPLRAATDVVAPGDAARAYEAENAAKTLPLDDGTNTNLQAGDATSKPLAYLANGSPARVGYRAEFTKPVILDSRRNAFVLQPTRMVAAHPDRSPVTISGERPEVPRVEGDTTVATFNVLNYFSDLGKDEKGCKGYADREGNFVTAKKCKVRGAWSSAAFANQQAKIVRAINEIDADVVALEEIENPVGVFGEGAERDAALKTLVDALNAAAGAEKWAYVPSPSTVPAKEDVIRIAFIYQKDAIAPVGESRILDDPAFTGLARQPLAQEFSRIVGADQEGKNVVVIANHFKSKGSVPKGMEEGNTDNGDGQGNANAIRVAQAKALARFAEQFKDKPTLLVGDFNSYSKEDPLAVLKDAGWTHESAGSHPSYVYGGRSGSLDHVFANASASALIAEVGSWALNAEESVAFEYSRANYNAHLALETDSPYRSSDHNPEIVGLKLIADEPAPNPGPAPAPDPADPGPAPAPSPAQPTAKSAPAATPAKPSMGLARTGTDGGAPIAAGVLLLGGLVLVATKRRIG